MKRILIGLAIIGAGTLVVFGARKGLEEHAAAVPVEVEAAAEANSEEGVEIDGRVDRVEPVDTSPPRSAEGLQPTDRGATHPHPSPSPLTPEPTPSEAAPPVETAPEQESEAVALLRRAAAVYSKAESLQADFSQRSMNPILRSTVESSGTLYQRHPDRFLMRFTDPEGDLIVSDGTYFWVYYPSVDKEQVMRMPASHGAGGVDLRAQFVGDPLERFAIISEGREEVGGRSTMVLRMNPRAPMGYRALKVWIDTQDYLIRRFEVTEENGMTRHFDLSNLRLNVRLSDDLFRFDPPAGARVVDRG